MMTFEVFWIFQKKMIGWKAHDESKLSFKPIKKTNKNWRVRQIKNFKQSVSLFESFSPSNARFESVSPSNCFLIVALQLG